MPVTALSPISRALCKEAMCHAGLLEPIAPQVWTIPWNVHSQANHHGHSACTSLAPYGFTVAISNRRLVSLQDRTVTFTSRKGGRARRRTPSLDAIEFLRRFLQPVLPDGLQTVRHFGLLHASCPVPLGTIRRMIGQAPPGDDPPPPRTSPPPRAARCPTCGTPMRLVLRLWPSSRGLVDTGGVAGYGPDERSAPWGGPLMTPVRLHADIRPGHTG